MTRSIFTLLLFSILLSHKTSAKTGYDEGSLFLKPIVYFNAMDIQQHDPNLVGLYARNTVSNSLNGLYTRVTKYGMIISSGFGAGERYYYLSTPLGEEVNTRVFYFNWDLNMGYRFMDKPKMKHDIRIGNLTNTALGERSGSGTSVRGTLGRSKDGNGTTMIQYAHWNTQINERIIIGLQVEHRFFMGKQKINYIESSYYKTGRDIYNSSQTGAALIVGLVL